MLRTLNALHARRAEWAQHEHAALTYTVNWAGLHADIAASTWTSDSGATLAGEAINALTTTARISGAVGCYDVTNQITTAAGEIDERVIRVRIRVNDRGPIHGDYGERYAT